MTGSCSQQDLRRSHSTSQATGRPSSTPPTGRFSLPRASMLRGAYSLLKYVVDDNQSVGVFVLHLSPPDAGSPDGSDSLHFQGTLEDSPEILVFDSTNATNGGAQYPFFIGGPMSPTHRVSWAGRRRLARAFAALSTTGLGCGARSDLGVDSSLAAGAYAFGSDADSPLVAPQDACQSNTVGTRTYQSEAELQALLVGRWMLCNPGTPNPYWSAAGVGLDILADGRVYPLSRDNYGQIVRGGGAIWAYSLFVIDDRQFDVTFELDKLSVSLPSQATFHGQLGDSPEKLTLDDGSHAYVLAPAQ